MGEKIHKCLSFAQHSKNWLKDKIGRYAFADRRQKELLSEKGAFSTL